MSHTADKIFSNRIVWHKTDDPEFPYETHVNNQHMKIRLNDFPLEPLYTLLINGDDVSDFDDWPANWIKS